MNFINTQQGLESLCKENIACCNQGCKLKHPRVLAGVCINHLLNICQDTQNCKGLQHLSLSQLKQELQNPPINGVYLFNICKLENCQNQLCRFVHVLWKQLICWKCLDVGGDCACEAHVEEPHDLQWLRDNVYDRYNIQEQNPENLCTCTKQGCKKKSHQLQMNNSCLLFFKGLCHSITCNQIHMRWEEFQQKAVQQNYSNQVIKPCIKKDNKQFIKQEQTYSITIFQPKILQETFNNAINEENIIDIIFILDCTSSMQRWIDKAKNSICRIIHEFKNKIPFQSRIRIAAVCFRDYDCGNQRIESHNFTTKAGLIESFIGKQIAVGGEDIPEDLLGALEAAYRLNISTQKLSLLNLVIMTDAPCHGSEYHDLMWDEYKDGQKGKLEEILQKFKQLKQRFFVTFFNLINNQKDKKTTQKMENIMKNELKNQFFTASIGEKQFADYVKFSLHASLDQKPKLRANNCKSFNTSCEKQSKMEFMYDKSNRQQTYLATFEAQLQQTKIITDTVLQIEVKKLKLGQMEEGQHCDIFKAFDTKKNTEIVLKIPKYILLGQTTENDIIQAKKEAILRYHKQLVAQQLMTLFNQRMLNHPDLQQQVCPYFYSSPCLYYFKEEKFYGLEVVYGETYINQDNLDWIKHSSDSDYANQAEEQIVTFSHFTYVATNEELMITDLQGKVNLLSDPAIHTQDDEQFLGQNLHQKGFEKFFQNQHPCCTQFCYALNIGREGQAKVNGKPKIPQQLIESQIKTQYLDEDNFVYLICQNCGRQEELRQKNDVLCSQCSHQSNNEQVQAKCDCCKKQFLQNYNFEMIVATVKNLCPDCKGSLCNKSSNPKCYYCNETVCLVFEHEQQFENQKIQLCIDATSYLNSLRCKKCNKQYSYQKLLSHEDYSAGKFECC